jgi:hypothetical protein
VDKRRLVLTVVVALFIGALGFAAVIFWQFRNSPVSDGHHPVFEAVKAKMDEYDRLIEREVPVGSSASQVEAFLSDHQIEHWGLRNIQESDSDFDQLVYPRKREVIRGQMGARVRNAEHEGVVEWSIQLRFYFDKETKLVAHSLDWVGTGP